MACLALPSSHFTRPPIVSWKAMSDDEFTDTLKRIHGFDEVFIHEAPQKDKLKDAGFERYPATYKDKEIWIRRKPVHDRKMMAAA